MANSYTASNRCPRLIQFRNPADVRVSSGDRPKNVRTIARPFEVDGSATASSIDDHRLDCRSVCHRSDVRTRDRIRNHGARYAGGQIYRNDPDPGRRISHHTERPNHGTSHDIRNWIADRTRELCPCSSDRRMSLCRRRISAAIRHIVGFGGRHAILQHVSVTLSHSDWNSFR